MDEFLDTKFSAYRSQKRVTEGVPKLPGKNAVIFCTYSGPHTGIREAIPPVLYAAQFFEHLGFAILGEWYVVGEFHGSLVKRQAPKDGLGDIRGRPNVEDLRAIKLDAIQVAKRSLKKCRV